jgi:hypothetical protein
MHTVHKTPAVTAAAKKTRDLTADLLVVPVFEDDDLADEPNLDRASGGEYAAARHRREFLGKPFEQLLVPIVESGWGSRRALFVGTGARHECTTEQLRRVATIGGLVARQHRFTSLAVAARPLDRVVNDAALQSLTEGVVLANYEGMSYKTSGHESAFLERAVIRIPNAAAAALEPG